MIDLIICDVCGDTAALIEDKYNQAFCFDCAEDHKMFEEPHHRVNLENEDE